MKPEDLTKELGAGRIRPAYLLLGEEPLLRDDSLAAIRGAVLTGSADDWNFDRLSGPATQPGQLQDSARGLPVMAEHRLVLLADPEGGRGGAKALTEALAEIVPELLGQGETVLVVTAAKADKRSRWYKAFAAEPAAVVDCEPPKNAKSLAAFVKAEAQRQGLRLESGVPALLAERIGPQLLMLRHELTKASLLAGPGETITARHVEVSASQVAEEPIWDLTDAIGAGRTADALALLSRMLRSGAPAPVILATLAGHFRKLARMRSGGRVAGAPFMVRKLESQARRYTSARLLACLRAIQETDTALKGAGTLPPELALERLVLGLSA